MANISWMQYCDLFYVEPSFDLFHHSHHLYYGSGNVAPPLNPPLGGYGDSSSFNILLEDEVAILEEANFNTRFLMEDETFMIDEIAEDLNLNSNDLSEETILRHLKTRIYEAAPAPAPAPSSSDIQEEDRGNICVVCQIEYENREIVGTLECGHEYHDTCIKTWLLQKNLCPLCKKPAIPQEER